MLPEPLRVALPVFLALGPLASGAGDKFSLTIDSIMQGPNLVGTTPAQVRWSGDSSKVYFQWKQASDPIIRPLDTYVVNRDGTGLRKLSEDEARLAPPASAEISEDGRRTVFAQEGDIVVIENATGTRRQMTKTSDAETGPHFLPDSKRITFTRGGNLYLLSLESGELEQLTDIRPAGAAPPAPAAGGRGGRGGTAPTAEPKGTDSQEYLKKEQREIFEVVRDRVKLREENEARDKVRQRKPYTLQARQSMTGLQLSPDGKYVTGVVVETANGTKNSNVPNWITDSSYPEDIPGRARVGDAIGHRKLVVLNVATGEEREVEHAGVTTPKAQLVDGTPCGGVPGDGGPDQIVAWSRSGDKSVFTTRSDDNKNCWLMALDVTTAKARVLFQHHDDAWIGGPGNALGWLADNETVYFVSEKDGFEHLYTAPFAGGEVRQLTSGKWEVEKVALSKDGRTFFVTSSEGSPYERHFWKVPVDGRPRIRMTAAAGMHAASLSPDEKSVADVYSYANKPPELYLQVNEPSATASKVTTSPAPEFASYAWSDTPIIEIPARDGIKVPAHLYKPAGFKKGGPAVIFVHGAGYAQNVHKGWSVNYFREYMFHHLLMEKGYLVMDLDYRGSKGYGRTWRTDIYRHMGGKDLDDQIDAARWMVAQHGVDPKRIGIYGGSYGGFITLMAMFREPNVFAAGAALRPVSDWALYNQQYSGNILNQPQKDSEAYKVSSPIYYAEGLKGRLLIAHGMVDTNVQFVDTVRLVQRLIELRKENWELAVYPVEDHTFVQSASWADEYKRILKLFDATLNFR